MLVRHAPRPEEDPMKAMIVRKAKSLALDEIPAAGPGRGEVRIRVHACGVCHSDHFVVDALWPGLALPRVPGHEVAGVVDAVGEDVTRFRTGDRVGLGWHGGHCGTCDACLGGHLGHCRNGRITGIAFDGGYGEFVVAPEVAVARMPEGIGFADAAPLLCAGVTTFNALRNAGARSGDLVAVQGLGGLGHLGVQYARAMGFEVAAISRGSDKEAFARKLGAHHYVDSSRPGFAEELTRRGGARVVLATAPHAASISATIPGLAIDGTLLLVAAPFEPVPVSSFDLIGRNARVQGWASGTAKDSEDAMAFAVRTGVRAMIERFPLPDAPRAYDAMMKGTVRFRAVLDVAEA
jgi:D-arabinose 1-dehydrogenase-like Zn-dependent alcohol dehydrogenase